MTQPAEQLPENILLLPEVAAGTAHDEEAPEQRLKIGKPWIVGYFPSEVLAQGPSGLLSGQSDMAYVSFDEGAMATGVTFAGPETGELLGEIQDLRERVAALEHKVDELKTSTTEAEVIVLRTITSDRARQEIMELFHSGETLFYSDIAQRLRIDLATVVEICEELRDAGEIEVDAADTS